MSTNTNEIFWVICGAVIIVAIFTLVQANVGGTVNGIFEYFNGLFTA